MDERRFVALILLGLSRHFSSLFLTSAFTWSSVCAGVRGWVCTCVCVCVGERETARERERESMCSAWRLASVCHVIIAGLLVSKNVHGVKMFVPKFLYQSFLLYQSFQEEGNNPQTEKDGYKRTIF